MLEIGRVIAIVRGHVLVGAFAIGPGHESGGCGLGFEPWWDGFERANLVRWNVDTSSK